MRKTTILLVVILALAATSWARWESETVASAGDVGNGCSLAVDRWGRPHISYIDGTAGEVMYATHNGTNWVFEVVASDVIVTGGTGIALDAFDNPYVVFQDDAAGELTYARRSGTNWVTEPIVSGANYGKYVSISAWPAGSHVSFTRQSGTETGLYYAYLDGEEWQTEMVVPSGGGAFNTILIDNNNRPNIVFWYGYTTSIRRAVRKGEAWEIDDIAEGIDCDACVGPDGNIHVSFPKVNNQGLNYAVSTSGGSWKIENINAYKGSPGYSQICVNAAGDVFVSYFNFDTHNLRVVIKKEGTWKHEIVARGGYVGLPHSSAVSGSRPMIAYYDGDNQDLKLARYDPDSGIEPPFPADRYTDGNKRTFALRQNAPNPVTGATTFSFELAEGSDVTLAVYDAAGRKVADVADGYFGPGEHDVSFAGKLAPGVYVYRLDAGTKTAARKMVVVE